MGNQTSTANYKGINSYKDEPDRAMNVMIEGGAQRFNANDCFNECKNYKYFALQNGNPWGGSQCFCSNNWNDSTRYGRGNCDTGGGPWCNYIYENKVVERHIEAEEAEKRAMEERLAAARAAEERMEERERKEEDIEAKRSALIGKYDAGTQAYYSQQQKLLQQEQLKEEQYLEVAKEQQDHETILNSIQNLQNLEKELHNELNMSMASNVQTCMSETVYVGNSVSNVKTIPLPTTLKFNSFDSVPLNATINEKFSLVILNDGASQVLEITRTDQLNGWNSDISFVGNGCINDGSSASPEMYQRRQNTIIKQINEIAGARVGLFRTLNTMHNIVQRTSTQSRNDLVHQLAALKIVESELKNAKIILAKLQEEKYNKLRMAEINIYESDRYNAYTKLFKIMLYFGVPIGILFIMMNMRFMSGDNNSSTFKLILRDMITIVIVGLMIVGLYRILMNSYDLSMRSNMNFNEYDFAFNQAADKPTLLAYDEAEDKVISSKIRGLLTGAETDISHSFKSQLECEGPGCCATGTVYSNKENKCVPHLNADNTNTTNPILSAKTNNLQIPKI